MPPDHDWTRAVERLESALAARESRQSLGDVRSQAEPRNEGTPRPIDIVYLFRHSANQDQEIRYSLRSVAAHLPFVRKVWIFGDRPDFLSADKSVVEHVPHAYLAPLFGYQVPIRSDFLMQFLASLIPELSPDFVRFADDYIVLQSLSLEQLQMPRALEDLNQPKARGQGKFKDLVWRTYDVLKHYGFAGYNFESHVPQPLTKRLVLEAFLAFREFLSEDRLESLLTLTCLYNYALKHHGLKFTWLDNERSRAGFYRQCPPIDQVVDQCRGKLFLNFDDKAWGPGIEEFLRERFPEPSKFEQGGSHRSPHAPREESITRNVMPTVARLTAAFAQAAASRGQMSPPQYFRVVLELLCRAPCKLLVVGAGRDTELYVQANRGGMTVVVERHAQWIDTIRHLDCTVLPVSYQTRLGDGLVEPCSVPEGVPPWVMKEAWDVILVDAPEGNDPDSPGRQQSIFLASQLVRPDTTVFVHDFNRPAEQLFASRYLKQPDERYGSQRTLAVFKYSGSD